MRQKIHYKNIEKLFGFTRQTWAKWQKEKRPISILINYFSDQDIKEFLKNGKIKKYDNLLKIQDIVINNSCNKYINTFIQNTQSNSIKFASPYFLDFYFSFLVNFNTSHHNNFITNLNNFFVDYMLNIDKKDTNKLKEISSYIYLFKNWDELMGIFLSQNIKNNLSILIENNDLSSISNKLKKEESYFHIIGLYTYHNHSSLKSGLKIELIKNLSDKTKDEFFTYDLLVDFIKKTVDQTIQALTELGFDKSLYSTI